MSRQMKILCGVPQEFCSGGHLLTDQHVGTKKCHNTRSEAMRCMSQYLTHQKDCEKLSSRMFKQPDGGSIIILPKVSRFGGRMRNGKNYGGARVMPERGSGLVF